MAIMVFVTGGTFDKEYDEINGKLYFKDTHLPEMFKLGRCSVDLRIRTLMMIDSLEMTEDDREVIIRQCKRCEEERIIITHGTDTMTKTAKALEKEKISKTIVLTGAMIPYKFGSSDGFFNLGSAMAFAQSLPHGVYIAMHGKFFKASKAEKNKRTGYFEELRG